MALEKRKWQLNFVEYIFQSEYAFFMCGERQNWMHSKCIQLCVLPRFSKHLFCFEKSPPSIANSFFPHLPHPPLHFFLPYRTPTHTQVRAREECLHLGPSLSPSLPLRLRIDREEGGIGRKRTRTLSHEREGGREGGRESANFLPMHFPFDVAVYFL